MLDALNHETLVTFLHHHVWAVVFWYCVVSSIFGKPNVVVNK